MAPLPFPPEPHVYTKCLYFVIYDCSCKLIELNLSGDDSEIVHLQDLSSDQEEDSDGSEVDNPECSIK